MKIFNYAHMAVLAILMLNSCNSITGFNIENEKDADDLKQYIASKVNTDKNITSISLFSAADLNTKIKIISIDEASDKDETNRITLNLGARKESEVKESKESNSDKENKGIKLADLDFKSFSENIKKLIAAIPDGYEYQCVSEYNEQFKNGKSIEVKGIIHALSKTGNSTKLKGNKLETTYYQLNFVMDASGKINIFAE